MMCLYSTISFADTPPAPPLGPRNYIPVQNNPISENNLRPEIESASSYPPNPYEDTDIFVNVKVKDGTGNPPFTYHWTLTEGSLDHAIRDVTDTTENPARIRVHLYGGARMSVTVTDKNGQFSSPYEIQIQTQEDVTPVATSNGARYANGPDPTLRNTPTKTPFAGREVCFKSDLGTIHLDFRNPDNISGSFTKGNGVISGGKLNERIVTAQIKFTDNGSVKSGKVSLQFNPSWKTVSISTDWDYYRGYLINCSQ